MQELELDTHYIIRSGAWSLLNALMHKAVCHGIGVACRDRGAGADVSDRGVGADCRDVASALIVVIGALAAFTSDRFAGGSSNNVYKRVRNENTELQRLGTWNLGGCS